MTNYEIYVFVLCVIVFTMFTSIFTYVIVEMTKMRLKMIANGLEDEVIIKEQQAKAKVSVGSIIVTVISLLLCLALIVAFIFSMYMHVTKNKAPNGIPSLKVVKSSSMASVNEKNKYIAGLGLTDQIQTFDVIVTRHLPEEEDLGLYDIVVYKQNDTYIIHRIVGIEEPNAEHPNCRHFLLQGDAVANPDQFPVLYSQMQGIYEGERIPYVGSFILFMQSPAGWLCIILVLFAMITTPILEKKLREAAQERLQVIGYADVPVNEEDESDKV